jgi:hypothetical protein
LAYLKIHSRDWINKYQGAKNNPLRLRVIRNSGVRVTPSDNIKISDLKKGKKNIIYKNFLNAGDGGITFGIRVIIHKKDKWAEKLYDKKTKKYVVNNPKVTTILKKFYAEMIVLNIVTDFIDVPNGNYIISKNPQRVQSTENYTEWELEFTTYRAVNTVKYTNNNSAVKKAIAKTKKANKKSTSKKTTKSSSSKNKKLANCKLSQIKYSKKQKTVKCVKYMQTVLYKKGYLTKRQIDGWYGPKTKNAVKRFQKKYKKTYNLKITGKIDAKTKNAMCKV